MDKACQEKRNHERYDTELKIYFDFAYDLETKIKFQLLDKRKKKVLSKKYSALSRNVSAEGLCFVAGKKLEKMAYLNLEVYLPSATEPVQMSGEVRWSRASTDGGKKEYPYQTGILLKTVENKSVPETIHYDRQYHVNWSIVLESLLGSFKDIVKEKQTP
jgi:hypothetical protein